MCAFLDHRHKVTHTHIGTDLSGSRGGSTVDPPLSSGLYTSYTALDVSGSTSIPVERKHYTTWCHRKS